MAFLFFIFILKTRHQNIRFNTLQKIAFQICFCRSKNVLSAEASMYLPLPFPSLLKPTFWKQIKKMIENIGNGNRQFKGMSYSFEKNRRMKTHLFLLFCFPWLTSQFIHRLRGEGGFLRCCMYHEIQTCLKSPTPLLVSFIAVLSSSLEEWKVFRHDLNVITQKMGSLLSASEEPRVSEFRREWKMFLQKIATPRTSFFSTKKVVWLFFFTKIFRWIKNEKKWERCRKWKLNWSGSGSIGWLWKLPFNGFKKN